MRQRCVATFLKPVTSVATINNFVNQGFVVQYFVRQCFVSQHFMRQLQGERTAQTGCVCIFIIDRIASSPAELRSCVKVEVDVLGSRP